MKKIGKVLIVCCLIAVMTLFTVACGGTTQDPEIPTTPDGEVETTIDDAYVNNRPNYDDIFDYESGYVPEEMIKPGQEFTLSIDESSSLKFADGSTAKQIAWGSSLTEEDFDVTGLGGRSLESLLVESGDGTATQTLAAFSMPKSATTISPYSTIKSGYKRIWMGSAKNSGKPDNFSNADFSAADFTVIGSDASWGSTPDSAKTQVAGGENGQPEEGVLFECGAAMNKGAGFRNNAIVNGGDGAFEIEKDKVYLLSFNFENKGEDNVALDIWAINTGTSKTSTTGNNNFKLRLAPGESVEMNLMPKYEVFYSGTTNDNVLMWFEVAKNMNGMKLGMSMSIKEKTDADAEPAPNPEPEPEPIITKTVTVSVPSGITVEGYDGTAVVGETLTVPSASQITNSTGKTIAGWYIAGNEITIIGANTPMPDTDITISPYFAPASGTALVWGSGNAGLPDYFGPSSGINYTKPESSTEYESDFTSTPYIIDGERGVAVTSAHSFLADDYFRMKTTATIIAKHQYKYTYKLVNTGDSKLSFELIQVTGGLKYKAEDGAVSSGTVSLEKGATSTITLTIPYVSADVNSLAMVMMKEAAAGMKLGVAVTIEDLGIIPDAAKYSLTLAGGSGVTFADGAVTADLPEGEAMPAVTNTTGRAIEGWYVGETVYAGDAFRMPAEATTISPYFAAADGYTTLTFGGGKNGSVPNEGNTSGVTATDFKFATGIVNGGENGFAQAGRIYTYTGAMPAGAYFRFDTVVNSEKKVVTLNKDHSFVYNFENKGATAIRLKLWQVNSGNNKEDGDQGNEIFLDAGQSITVSFIANFKKGNANNNALSHFEVVEEMATGMKLGVTMAVKLAV